MSEEIKDFYEELIEYSHGGMSGLYPSEDIAKEFVNYIEQLQKENKKLNNVINKFEEMLKKETERTYELIKDDFKHGFNDLSQYRRMMNIERENWLFILNKLKGSDE